MSMPLSVIEQRFYDAMIRNMNDISKSLEEMNESLKEIKETLKISSVSKIDEEDLEKKEK